MATTRTHQVGTPAKKIARPAMQAEPVPDDNDILLDEEIQPMNLLQELEAELGGDAEIKPLRLTVPNRPKLKLVFSPNFDFPTYQAWTKRAEDKKTKDTDLALLSVIVISNTNIGITLNDQEVETDGTPWTVARPEVHQFLKSPIGGTSAAIRKLYGSDGHMIQAARMVIEAAGYTLDGDVQEDGGPLEG